MFNRTKIAVLSALSNLAWFLLTFLWNRPRTAPLGGEALERAWGMYVIVLLAGFLVLDVLCAVLVMTGEKRSGGQGFEEKTDERDRRVEGFATKALSLGLGLSLLVPAVLLALGRGLSVFFSVMAFLVLLSSLAMWITYIIGYERGL